VCFLDEGGGLCGYGALVQGVDIDSFAFCCARVGVPAFQATRVITWVESELWHVVVISRSLK